MLLEITAKVVITKTWINFQYKWQSHSPPNAGEYSQCLWGLMLRCCTVSLLNFVNLPRHLRAEKKRKNKRTNSPPPPKKKPKMHAQRNRKSQLSYVLPACLDFYGGCLNVQPTCVLNCVSSGDLNLFGADASNSITFLSIATKDCYHYPGASSFLSRCFWLLPC